MLYNNWSGLQCFLLGSSTFLSLMMSYDAAKSQNKDVNANESY